MDDLEIDTKIVYITRKNIEGLDTRLVDLCSYIRSLISSPIANEHICIAGGFILDAVSRRSYGHLLQQSDIDIWLLNTISSENRNTCAIINVVLEWCHSVDVMQNTSGSILYTRCKTTGREVQIINTELYTLEQVLLSFDNPSCQVGIKFTPDSFQIVCTSDFLQCMETGIIHWWNSGNFDRISKYKSKGFTYPEWMNDICYLSTIYSKNTIDKVARIPWGKSAFTNTIKKTYGNNSWQIIDPDTPFSIGNTFTTEFAVHANVNGLFDTLTSGNSWCVGKRKIDDETSVVLKMSIQDSQETKLKDIFEKTCFPYLKENINVPEKYKRQYMTDITYFKGICNTSMSERNSQHDMPHITIRLNNRTVIVSDECSWTGTSLDPWKPFFQNRDAYRLRVFLTIKLYSLLPDRINNLGIILTARVIHIIRHGSKTKSAKRQYDIDYTY